MGKLAFDLATCHSLGSARGINSHLGSMQISAEKLLQEFGKTVDGLMVEGRETLEGYYAEALRQDPIAAKSMFRVSRRPSDPKRRWVDGTPEYSLYIWPLLKLFPRAKFIHIVRDVNAVVRSLLQFSTTGAPPVVENEQAAYDYWLRTVRSCLEAERALGSQTVARVRYEDLLALSNITLERCLNFVGEDFCADCLDPLKTRINSSQVPDDFEPFDPQTDPAVREAAEQLNAELSRESAPTFEHDDAAAAQFEKAFRKSARHLVRLNSLLEAAVARAAVAEHNLHELRKSQLTERLRAIVANCTEFEAIVAVISKGDETITDLCSREVWHFPRDPQAGCYAGYCPADSAEAIAHVEALREQGANYLLIPDPSLWWLDYYSEFAEHLNREYRRVWAEDAAVLFNLDGKNQSLANIGQRSMSESNAQ